MPPTETDGERPRRRPLVAAVSTGVPAVLIGVAAAFGGLRAQPSGPVKGGPGTTYDQGLFEVAVLDAHLEHRKDALSGKTAKVLAVRMHVTLKDKTSHGLTDFLDGMVAEPKPGTYVDADQGMTTGLIDGAATTEIHPRMPIDVLARWPIPGTATPSTVTIALRKWTHTQGFDSPTYYWYAGKSSSYAAKVVVPVRAAAQ